MLRITCIRENEGSVTFKLEGQITQPGIDVILHECIGTPSRGRRVIFDLTDVSFIDRSFVKALVALMRDRVELIGCSPFLSGLIEDAEKSVHKSNHQK